MSKPTDQKGFKICVEGFADHNADENALKSLEEAVQELFDKYKDKIEKELNKYGSLKEDDIESKSKSGTLSNFVITAYSNSNYPRFDSEEE